MLFTIAAVASAAIPPLKVNPLGKPDAPVEGKFQRNVFFGTGEDFSPMSSSEYVSRQRV